MVVAIPDRGKPALPVSTVAGFAVSRVVKIQLSDALAVALEFDLLA
jgi:hypothetical protein